MSRKPHLSLILLVAALAFALGHFTSRPGSPALAADEKPAAQAKSSATFEVYKDKSGEFRWRLRHTNKQILATSGDGYKAKQDCLTGIDSVKKNAPDAKVEEEQPQAK